MKKMLALILAAMMILSLAACNFFPADDEIEDVTETIVSEAEPEPEPDPEPEYFSGKYKYTEIIVFYADGSSENFAAGKKNHEYLEFFDDGTVDWEGGGGIDKGTYEKYDDTIYANFPTITYEFQNVTYTVDGDTIIRTFSDFSDADTDNPITSANQIYTLVQ